MNSPLEQYRTLLALTKNFLLEEYGDQKTLLVKPQSAEYFSRLTKKSPPPPTSPTTPIFIKSEVKRPPLPRSQPPNPTPKAEKAPTQSAPVASPVEEKPKEVMPQVSVTSKFKLEPMQPPSLTDFTSLRKAIKEHYPEMKIMETPPPDTRAAAIKEGWKTTNQPPTALIILGHESAKTLQLAENISKAITLTGGKASVLTGVDIERSSHGWENHLANNQLQVVLLSTSSPLLPRFKSHCTKTAGQELFGNAPILPCDLNRCLIEPQRKSELWQAILKQPKSSRPS